jgi:hypothetical protein
LTDETPSELTDVDPSDEEGEVEDPGTVEEDWTPLEIVLDAEEKEAESPDLEAGPTKRPALTDEEIVLKRKQVELESKEADLAQQRHELDTEKDNRRLRTYVARGALLVMLGQIVAANATFVWYGDTNGWDISPTAISAWMGATVVQVVSVVLVITNYLFPNPKKNVEHG